MSKDTEPQAVMQPRSRLVRHVSLVSALLVAGVLLTATAPATARVLHFVGPASGTVTCNSLSLHVKFSQTPNLGRGATTAGVVGTAKDCAATGSGETISHGNVTGSFANDPLSCTSSSPDTNETAEVTLMVRWSGTYEAHGFAGVAHFSPSYITFTSDEFYPNESGHAGFLLPGEGGASWLTAGSSFDDNNNGTSSVNTYAIHPSDSETSLSAKCKSKSEGGAQSNGISSLSFGSGSITIGADGPSSTATTESPTGDDHSTLVALPHCRVAAGPHSSDADRKRLSHPGCCGRSRGHQHLPRVLRLALGVRCGQLD